MHFTIDFSTALLRSQVSFDCVEADFVPQHRAHDVATTTKYSSEVAAVGCAPVFVCFTLSWPAHDTHAVAKFAARARWPPPAHRHHSSGSRCSARHPGHVRFCFSRCPPSLLDKGHAVAGRAPRAPVHHQQRGSTPAPRRPSRRNPSQRRSRMKTPHPLGCLVA